MVDKTVIRKRLADAEEKYHRLQLGGVARVTVDQSGERVEFTAANRDNLRRYINELKEQLRIAEGGRAAGPLRFVW